MKWFHNLKIPVKFVVCFIAFLIILIVANIGSLRNTQTIHSNLVDIYENNLSMVEQLNELSGSIHRINTAVGSYLLVTDADSRKKQLEKVDLETKSVTEKLGALDNGSLTQGEKDELQLLSSLWESFQPTVNNVFQLVNQNQMEQAKSMFDKQLLAKEEGIEEIFQELLKTNQQQAESKYLSSIDKHNQVKRSTLILMVVSLVIFSVMGLVLTYSIVLPIRQLLKAFKRVEEGDLSQPVEIQRRDELGLLANGFEIMRESVASIVSQTKQTVGTLSHVSDGIREYALTTAQSSQEIYGGLERAADHSREQKEKVHEDVVVIKEMSAGLKQMAASIDEVSNLSSDMEMLSNQGQTSVKGTLEKMQLIEQKSRETESKIEQLADRSKEIDTVIATIKNIAEETNLLALNASIEAARAGEAGSGFAVVAHEVRKLAEHSRSAADHVRSVVTYIQEDTGSLLQSSQAWILEMNEGQQKVGEVSEAFRQMNGWIERINGMIQDISAGIEEMAAGSEQMDISMKRIEDYSAGVNEVTREYSEKSGQQALMMDKVNSSVEELAKLSHRLQTIVNRFVTDSVVEA
ncbi:methyl-accepting chemotaxis protein [Paenibacillus validus]|uniref:HAMP domain-containing protein n=1 Tax=Paenibacillus validus TaxID=44253 RepID=A0A7X3CUD2_9BACL|nr:methyl-accepting chemotaxis protein [Paenibacillus validus]MUG72012.1 HAMP domain-containing protein [Paenibacillus validus]